MSIHLCGLHLCRARHMLARMCAEFTSGPQQELDRILNGIRILRRIIREQPLARIFPRGTAPILLKNEDGNYEVMDAEFSLIPPWWNPDKAPKKTKNNRPAFATHNARLESIEEKPTFKESFQRRHCIVPLKDFYESALFGDHFAGNRIKLTTGEILFAAGCYSTWLDKSSGELVHSFTIITSLANEQILNCGHDRMPIFLDPRTSIEWLNSSGGDLKALKKFLVESNQNKNLKFEVSVDRALKDGWQKNAPTEDEMSIIRGLVFGE